MKKLIFAFAGLVIFGIQAQAALTVAQVDRCTGNIRPAHTNAFYMEKKHEWAIFKNNKVYLLKDSTVAGSLNKDEFPAFKEACFLNGKPYPAGGNESCWKNELKPREAISQGDLNDIVAEGLDTSTAELNNLVKDLDKTLPSDPLGEYAYEFRSVGLQITEEMVGACDKASNSMNTEASAALVRNFDAIYAFNKAAEKKANPMPSRESNK